jgi:hypothetical protein
VLEKVRPRSIYDVMALIACVGVVAGGTAYAANTIGSSDVVDESLLSQDIKNGEVKATELAGAAVTNSKLATNAVGSGKVDDENLTALDLGPDSVGTSEVAGSALTGADVSFDSLTGSDIRESSLSVNALGCQSGKVLGFARVKGSSGVPAFYTPAAEVVDTKNNCSGGVIEVRRSAVGVYFVRFAGMSARLALAVSNSDGFGVQSTAIDNVVSVNKITGGADIGSFRVEVEDINADGTSPQDDWFTIMAF